MDARVQKLVELVENLIANEPYELGGFKWAARPQAYYAEAAGISVSTLGRRIRQAPFVRRNAIVHSDSDLEGLKLCLLRIGIPPDKNPNDYKWIMAGIWKEKLGTKVSKHQEHCLWGFANEVPGELCVQAFRFALDHWDLTALAIKLAAEMTPDYTPRFWKFPNIPAIRRFHKAVVYTYLMDWQERNVSNSTVTMAERNMVAAILTAFDPLRAPE